MSFINSIRFLREGEFLESLGGVGGAVSAGLGVAQAIGGFIEKGRARKEMARLQAQRKPYTTPDEIYQMLQATQQNAQSGFGAEILNYLTGNADRAFSSSIGAAELLGGDPNDLSDIFEKRVNESMRIAGESHAQKMANFGMFLKSLNVVGENKAAEWQSRDNILKDKIQAVAARGGDAVKNIGSGISNVIGALSAGQIMKLYGDNNNPSGNYLAPNDYVPAAAISNYSAPSTVIPRAGSSTSSVYNPYDTNLNNFIGYKR